MGPPRDRQACLSRDRRDLSAHLRRVVAREGGERALPKSVHLSLENGDILRLLPCLLQHQPPPDHLLHLVLALVDGVRARLPHPQNLLPLCHRHRQILDVFPELLVLELFGSDLLVRLEEPLLHVLDLVLLHLLAVPHLFFESDVLGGLAVVLPPLDRHLQVLRHPEKLEVADVLRHVRRLELEHLVLPVHGVDLVAERLGLLHKVELLLPK
mmetsp:Transcript_54588/g.124767  ORF Transcript_54588/g.124767 Transcript_54588/m.124767 type:complete len:212 (-) Transcript_54588:627-1262(-)